MGSCSKEIKDIKGSPRCESFPFTTGTQNTATMDPSRVVQKVSALYCNAAEITLRPVLRLGFKMLSLHTSRPSLEASVP